MPLFIKNSVITVCMCKIVHFGVKYKNDPLLACIISSWCHIVCLFTYTFTCASKNVVAYHLCCNVLCQSHS